MIVSGSSEVRSRSIPYGVGSRLVLANIQLASVALEISKFVRIIFFATVWKNMELAFWSEENFVFARLIIALIGRFWLIFENIPFPSV